MESPDKMSGMLRSFWGWTSADTPTREEAEAWAQERRERKAAAKAAKAAKKAAKAAKSAAAAALALPPRPPRPAAPLYEFTALSDVLAQAKKDLALIRTSRCQILLPSGAVVTTSPSQATATGQVAQPVAVTPLQASNHANPIISGNPRPDSIVSQAPSFQSVIHPSSPLAQRSPSIPEGSPYLAQPSPSLASQDAAFLDSIQRSPSIIQRSPPLAQAPNSPIELTRTLSAAQRAALRISLGSPLPGDIARTAPQLPNVIQRRSSIPVESLTTEGPRRSVSFQYYAEVEDEDQQKQYQDQAARQLQAVTEDLLQTQSRPSSIKYEGPGPLGSSRRRPTSIQYEGPGPLGRARSRSPPPAIQYEGPGPLGGNRRRPFSFEYEGPGPLGSNWSRPTSVQYEGPGPLGSARSPRPSIQYEGRGPLGSTRSRPSPIHYEGPGPLGSAAAAGNLSNPDGTTINTNPHPVPTAEQLAIEAEIAERLQAIAGILGNINSSRSQLQQTGIGTTSQARVQASTTPNPTPSPAATNAAPAGPATTYLERIRDGEVYIVARRARATELTDGQGRIGATGSVPVMRVPDCGI
ncbi:hypothetical protein NA56DRAFT_750638 [Hyaloscypha hepaticicola]|uniref:Uncharacterized protein n=1 Tax=Hyaloscypha hepaticicola TaxID=2082293 RepID=A0A2J6PYQ1_9HELO|nr:hypothetical protein NA56DRAFT_750638 [Hyaloscypha hepaticicola]